MSDNRLALSVAVAAGEDYVKRAINSAEWRGTEIGADAGTDIFRDALAEVWRQLLKTHAIVPRNLPPGQFLDTVVATPVGWAHLIATTEVKP